MSASPMVKDIVLESFCKLLRTQDEGKDPCVRIEIPNAPKIQKDLIKNNPNPDIKWDGDSGLRKIQRAIETLNKDNPEVIIFLDMSSFNNVAFEVNQTVIFLFFAYSIIEKMSLVRKGSPNPCRLIHSR